MAAGGAVYVLQGKLLSTGTNAGVITNAGTFQKSTGTVNTSSIDHAFVNTAGGTFKLLSGTLTLGLRAGPSGYSYYQTGGDMELGERTRLEVKHSVRIKARPAPCQCLRQQRAFTLRQPLEQSHCLATLRRREFLDQQQTLPDITLSRVGAKLTQLRKRCHCL